MLTSYLWLGGDYYRALLVKMCTVQQIKAATIYQFVSQFRRAESFINTTVETWNLTPTSIASISHEH